MLEHVESHGAIEPKEIIVDLRLQLWEGEDCRHALLTDRQLNQITSQTTETDLDSLLTLIGSDLYNELTGENVESRCDRLWSRSGERSALQNTIYSLESVDDYASDESLETLYLDTETDYVPARIARLFGRDRYGAKLFAQWSRDCKIARWTGECTPDIPNALLKRIGATARLIQRQREEQGYK